MARFIFATLMSFVLGFGPSLSMAKSDPGVPFPWGRAHEETFPWENVNGDWILNPTDLTSPIISVRSRTDVTGRHHLIVTQLDRESGRVLARGRASQTELEQSRVPVTLISKQGRRQIVTFVHYKADTGETAFVAKIDGYMSLASTYVLKRAR